MKSGLPFLVAALAVVWALLTASLRTDELAAGALAVLVVALATRSLRGVYGGLRVSPKAAVYAFGYVFLFLRELFKANIDVAARVLNPALPIKPGIVEVKTGMRSPLGKLILANSITLTPGTLTLDVRGDSMFIHWIDVRGRDAETATNAIVGTFERTLKEVVE